MLLRLEDVTVHYGRLAALRGLNLHVEAGEVVSIVGQNGAGKSTTMLAIAGILKPSGGRIVFDDQRIDGEPAELLAKRGISLVPEGRHVFTTMTVQENLLVGMAMRRDRAQAQRDLAGVFERFPILGRRRHQSAGKLSGGEQQMLVIGRALVTKPRLMLIDEPSLGLAPMIVDSVYEAVLELNRREGLSLLIVEQSAARALRAAHRLYVLRSGELRLSGASAQLASSDALHAAYFGFAHTDPEIAEVL